MQLQHLSTKIHEIRGRSVMLDSDLAELYKVSTKSLNLRVKRNLNRFPGDFMFQLSKSEWQSLRFQNETSKKRGGSRYLPYAFTEQGIAMLSGILNSPIAIEVNISIMRTFVLMRQFALSHKELTARLQELENKFNQHFNSIHEVIDYLMKKDAVETSKKKRKRIGYK